MGKICKIKLILFLLLDFLFIIKNKIMHRQRKANEKTKILVVRLDAIGDFFMWLPYAKALRDAYPSDKFELSLLGSKSWMEAAQTLLDFDNYIPFETTRYLQEYPYHYLMLKTIYQGNYDMVLQPRLSREFLVEDMITVVSDAPFSLCFKCTTSSINPVLMKWSDKWYSDLLPFVRRPSGNTVIGSILLDSEFAANEQFLKALNINFTPTSIKSLIANVRNHTSKIIENDYFVVISGCSWKSKCWPVTKTSATVKAITEKYDIKAVICGCSDSNDKADYIEAQLRPEHVINLNGKTSLLEFIDLIANANFILANDTGGVHIAAAAKVKSFCTVGGGHFGRFLPYPKFVSHIYEMPAVIKQPMTCYGCNWQCAQLKNSLHTYPCISSIKPDEVFNKINNYLSHEIYPEVQTMETAI